MSAVHVDLSRSLRFVGPQSHILPSLHHSASPAFSFGSSQIHSLTSLFWSDDTLQDSSFRPAELHNHNLLFCHLCFVSFIPSYFINAAFNVYCIFLHSRIVPDPVGCLPKVPYITVYMYFSLFWDGELFCWMIVRIIKLGVPGLCEFSSLLPNVLS